MSNPSDFVIENGVLKQYVGPGGDVVIPDGVTQIEGYWYDGVLFGMPQKVYAGAFSGCDRLLSVTIPEGVTAINKEAFFACKNLKNVRLPESLKTIGWKSFMGCSSLSEIVIPDGVTAIYSKAFDGTALSRDKNRLDNNVLYLGNKLIRASLFLSGEYEIKPGTNCIAASAFSGCRSLTSVKIPEGIITIENGTFSACGSLTNVTLPDEIRSIGDYAFSGCGRLLDISIPEGVMGIGERAFENCAALTDVTIPGSVTSLAESAFSACAGLTNVTIHEGTKRIGTQCFEDCANLKFVRLPKSLTSIGVNAFSNCKDIQFLVSPVFPTSKHAPGTAFPILDPAKTSCWYAYAAKDDCDNLSDYAKEGGWCSYDLELINNGPKYKYKLPARLLGGLGRLLYPTELTEENRALLTELLNKNAKKLVPLAEELGDAAILRDVLSLNTLDAKSLKALQKTMAASYMPEISALAESAAGVALSAKSEKKPSAPADPVQAEFAAKLKAIKGNAVIKKMKLIGIAMPEVRFKDGTVAPEELFRFLLASYGVQTATDFTNYHFVQEADEAAKLLSYDSLCEAMDTVSGHLDGPNYRAVLPLLCRYGNARQIQTLTEAYKEWGDWDRFGQKGRNAQDVLLCALVLSDTREAILWLEKNWNLAAYAALRSVTEADIYEQYLFDFGFDETGKRLFDLGGIVVELSLTSELGLILRDKATGKTLKSLPGTGVDPEKQKRAEAELADVKQSLKKAAKVKKDQLFTAYLDGTETSATAWKKRYGTNPFLRKLSELLVWSQGTKSFRITKAGAVDSAENPYEIGKEAIRLAHPMEMDADEVTAWQKHYTRHSLKQPFQQIWEPVYEKDSITADRYKGCRINPIYLKHQEKRGISADWFESAYSPSKYVRIRDFEVRAADAPRQLGEKQTYLQLLSVVPEVWNRRANSVIAYLDRITVFERIKKDDAKVMDIMDVFTLAQIMEFIAAAQEANAVNVLALLLEYKNAHFADFDPMDEFTLEW